jgi:hypothetical protein
MHSPRIPDSEFDESERVEQHSLLKKGKGLKPFKGLSLPSMVDQTSDLNISEVNKVPDQDNRFKLPALKLPLNLNKASAMLSPTATSNLSIDQYVTSGRDDEEKLANPTRKRGNASTLRPSAY